ncbi:MAG: DUF1109 domain-containing protein [bacterium]|nr:hypothetical protein [Deltaproteobacteria bacterium]MCP4905798.1 DUF1109 domain-containing protein [bacterium]
MTGSTDRLISGLVDDLESVRPLPRLRFAFAIVLAVWATVLGVVLSSQETPLGAHSLLADRVFLAAFLGLLVAALGATMSALAAGQPGRERAEIVGLTISLVGLLGAALACVVGMGSFDLAAHPSPPGADAMCFQKGALMSVLPSGVILSFLVRGWTAHPIRAALTAAVAAGALGATIVHLSCELLGPRHLLMGHLSVPIVLGLIGLYPLGALLRRLRS